MQQQPGKLRIARKVLPANGQVQSSSFCSNLLSRVDTVIPAIGGLLYELPQGGTVSLQQTRLGWDRLLGLHITWVVFSLCILVSAVFALRARIVQPHQGGVGADTSL